MYVGTSPGALDLFDSGALGAAVLSSSATGLPNDGSTIYVRLWFKISGVFQHDDFQYTAVVEAQPRILSPEPGSTQLGTTVTFTWTPGDQTVTEWLLYVGTSPGALDLFDSGALGAAVLSSSVTGLPNDGSTIYVRLWFKISGVFQFDDFQYTAAGSAVNQGASASGLTIGDGFEENDSRETATSLTPGTYPDLIAQINNDNDWYAVEVCAGSDLGDLSVTVQFAHTLGDIELYVFGALSTVIGSSATPTDLEEVVLTGLAAGTYFILVLNVGTSSDGNFYDLIVDVTCAGSPEPGAHDQEIADLILKLDTLLELEQVDEDLWRLVRLELRYLDEFGGLPNIDETWDILDQVSGLRGLGLPPFLGPNQMELKHQLLGIMDHALNVRNEGSMASVDELLDREHNLFGSGVDEGRVRHLRDKLSLLIEVERIEVKLKKLILGELKLLSEKPDLDPNLQDTLDRVTNLTWRLMALEGVVVDKPEQVLKEKAMDLIGRVGEMAEEEFGPFSLTAFIAPGDIWLKLDAMFELEQVKLKIKGSLLLELDQTRRRAKDAGESTELLISLGQLRGLVIDMVALERGFRPIGDGEEALLLERAIEIAGTALSQARGFGIQAMVEELGWKLEALRSTAQADRFRLMKDAASRQLERLLFFAEQRGSSEELIDTSQATWEIVQRLIAIETPPGPGLTLEPGRARNLVGQDHVLQVTVTGEGGQPAPAGTVVFYEVLDRNGVVVTSGFTETTGGLPGSGGEAVAFFSYGNDAPAVHQIRAWTDTTTYDEATRRDTAIKVWVALGDLTLTPETANNPVGQEHVVEARVTDGSGAPVPAGLEVFFEVLDQGGNVVASGTSETTGGDGLALFSYSSTAPGTHTIRAWTGGGPAPVLLATGNAPDSVFRYDGQNGAFIDQFVPAGSGGLGLPRDLIYGPDGNLYVNSDAFDKVLRYDGTTGAFIDKFVPDGSGGLSAPYGLVYGPDGNLYVSGFTSNAVHRYDGVSGAFIDLFVPVGSGGLVTPRDLVFGPDGNLYVVAHDSVNVLRYDGGTGAFIDVFASGGGLDSPAGLAFGPDGNLYVSSGGNDVVLRYDGITGAFIDVFIAAGSGGLDSPHGLVFTRDGNLYLASTNTDSVLRYDATTAAFIDEFVASGSGGLNAPHFLVFVAVQTTFDTAIPNLRDQATKEWFEPVSLHGQKWDDLNGNGIWDAGEPGLDGWPIELLDANGQVLAIQTTHSGDFNDDGQIDPVTEQGLYWFNDLRPGDYEVREVPPIFCCNPRWVQTFPGGTAALGEGPAVPETYLVTIDNGQTLENLNFGNHLPPPGSIHGQKWDDLNGDGVWDANEPGLNGWTIELVDSTGQVVATQVTDDMDLNEDGTIDPTEQGWYWFTGLEPGNYDVREESQPGWKQTFPVDTTGQAIDFYFVNLVEGQRVEGKDFGNYRVPTTGEDDQFEDNDTINTATSLAGGEFPDLIALDGDDDWYVVEVCADGNLRVTLQFAHVLGDIDLEVYDAAGNLIDSSTSTGDGEALVLSGLPPGLYFIRVYLFGGEAEGNNYDLLVDPCAQIGGDDQFEENDSLTGAASLLAPAFFPGLIVRIDDEDWFKVEVCPDGTLGVSLSLVHAQGDIDLEIYDAAGNLLAESASTENREEVVLTGLGAGTYFIRVFLFGGDFNGYELAVLVTCGSSIHGQKWNDLNGNGFWDDNEPGLDGFLIELRDPFTSQPVAIPNNPQETHRKPTALISTITASSTPNLSRAGSGSTWSLATTRCTRCNSRGGS